MPESEPIAKVTIIVEQGNRKTTIEVPSAENFLWTDKLEPGEDDLFPSRFVGSRRQIGLTFIPIYSEPNSTLLYRETIETTHYDG